MAQFKAKRISKSLKITYFFESHKTYNAIEPLKWVSKEV